jgi:glycine cleavage system H protein
MPDAMTFLMGEFPAQLPGDLRYAPRNHMWCRSVSSLPLGERAGGEGRFRFGFTAYAVRLMQDVYFLDWSVSAGASVNYLQQIGHIETSKAESDLFAPLAGTIVAFNQELLKDPSAINVDKYGAGWLFEMQGDAAGLVSVTEYHQYLTDNWEHTQRVIKGKINME